MNKTVVAKWAAGALVAVAFVMGTVAPAQAAPKGDLVNAGGVVASAKDTGWG
jgi:hypothetical protein